MSERMTEEDFDHYAKEVMRMSYWGGDVVAEARRARQREQELEECVSKLESWVLGQCNDTTICGGVEQIIGALSPSSTTEDER